MVVLTSRTFVCTTSTVVVFLLQVKRIHEYKRQLLNLLGIIHRYDAIKKMTPEQRSKVVPRVCIIGGKVRTGGLGGEGNVHALELACPESTA